MRFRCILMRFGYIYTADTMYIYIYIYIYILSLYASVGGNPRMPREAISGKVVINRTGLGPVRAQYSSLPGIGWAQSPDFLVRGDSSELPEFRNPVRLGVFSRCCMSSLRIMTHLQGDSGCRWAAMRSGEVQHCKNRDLHGAFLSISGSSDERADTRVSPRFCGIWGIL